jgi:HAD superfamily hydrolase (TIGR01509 family)
VDKSIIKETKKRKKSCLVWFDVVNREMVCKEYKENECPSITHVIFDMDGVLLNTEDIYYEVTNEILQRYGQTFEFNLRAEMMGRPALDAANILVDYTGIPMSAVEYLNERDVIHNERFTTCKPLPGVLTLVRHLKAKGIPMAVATSSTQVSFKYKTDHNQHLFQLFDVIVTTDHPNVKRGKPEPDIYLEAQRQLGIHKEILLSSKTALVFEDTIAGMRAALAAGMHVVLLPHPQLDKEETQMAHEVILSMDLFRPERWGLPAYDLKN